MVEAPFVVQHEAGAHRLVCGVCGAVVYPDLLPPHEGGRMGPHRFQFLSDGRARLVSVEFRCVVHECAESWGLHAQIAEFLAGQP